MPDQPPKQPTTVEIQPPPAWAIEMATRLQDGIAAIRADVSLVSNDVTLIKDRVTLVESRTAVLEGRADTNSMRAQSQSEVDATQSAQLAQERAAREAVTADVALLKVDVSAVKTATAAQTVILDRLDKLTANPTVKLFVHAVVVAFLYWLASKGIKVPQ